MSLLIFGHAGFGISFCVLASEIILYFFWNNQTALWIIFGIFLFIAVIELLLLYELYFTYEAIKSDEVYVRRFFKTKRIKVNDIRRINNLGHIVGFYGKQNKCLFLVDSFTTGINELIRIINERKSTAANDDIQEDPLAEENAILAKLGWEYRANYKERRKKFLITFLTVGTAIMATIVLFVVFIADTVTTVCIGLLGALALAVNLFANLNTMKKELSEDDVSLGNKHKFNNKKVKGASKRKFITILIICICAMVLGASFLLPLLSLFGEPKSYNEYTPITGKLEYSREQIGKNNYIAIGLYDIPTEYRLYSIYIDEFDYSFFDEVAVGDTVTIYIDDSENREFTLGTDKKLYNSFYYLSANGKEYFSYEDYIKSHEHNDYVAWVIVYLGITILATSTISLIIGYFVCKKRRKYEDIEIYKS